MLKLVRYGAWALVLIAGFVATSILMDWWLSQRSQVEIRSPSAAHSRWSITPARR
jgi:hypothetical protein